MSDKSELEVLLQECVSDDPDIAKAAQEKLAKALETPLVSKVRDDDEGVDK